MAIPDGSLNFCKPSGCELSKDILPGVMLAKNKKQIQPDRGMSSNSGLLGDDKKNRMTSLLYCDWRIAQYSQ